jgi:hypothetical protein
MNRKIVSLNLALLALIGLLVWQLRERREQASARERAVLLKGGRNQALLAPPPPPPVPPVAPAEYIDTVQKMLFSKDRNPNVIIDVPPPPPPPPPPPKMPALPHYYGQIRFGGDPVVILSGAAANNQKGYAVGEQIGEFKVVSFDHDSITFDWNGQEVVRTLAELKPKDVPPPQQPAAAQTPAQPAASNGVVSIGANGSNGNLPSVVGNDMGAGNFACKMDDTSPAGTVAGGYKKVVTRGLMGNSCYWEQVK